MSGDRGTELPSAAKRDLPWVTIVLVAINLAVFAWEMATADFVPKAKLAGPSQMMSPTSQWLADHGGNLSSLTLAGEPWRLLTSMFLHGSLFHIAMNMLGLYSGGRQVESMYGRTGMTAIFMVSGLGGSLASALRSNLVVSVGASGAVFGVVGAFGAFLLLHRGRLDPIKVSNQARGLFIFLAVNLVFGISSQGIDLLAHLGGLVAGFGVGIALEIGTAQGRSTVKRAVVVGVLGSGLVFGATLLFDPPRNVELEARNKVHDLDMLINLRGKPLQDPEILADKAQHIVDDEILPAIREARQLYDRDGDGPDAADIRRYLRLREEGFTELSKGIRDQDEGASKRAAAKFNEATELVEAINKRNQPDN